MRLLSYLFGRESPPERRVSTLQVTAEALLGIFRLDGTQTLRMEGVPEDAKVESMWVDSLTQTLLLGLSSAEFPIVGEGMPMPSIQVSIYVTHQAPLEIEA